MAKRITTKSLTKRIRFTNNGKAMRRRMGGSHFKTRKNADGVRRKRFMITINIPSKKLINY